MDWLVNWNQALDYLEANLDGDIHLEELGRFAGCSAYHFQRMFSYLAEVPLGEYIRRRRMTRAATDLQNGCKVLEVALRYGYESPTAFNRAFQAVHGIPPSQAKQPGAKLKAFPRIHFKLVLKGAVEMEYQIVKREAFRIVGFCTSLPADLEKSFQKVPQFWMEVGPRQAELFPLMDGEPVGILGVSTCNELGTGACEPDNEYYIAVASNAPAPEGMHTYMVPAATWAVFSGTGRLPEAMQELQKRIVTEWLPDSGWSWAKAPDVEVYLNQPGEESRFQIWLPVTQE